jgi:hypothetical protein
MHRFGRQEPRLDELRLHDIHRFILERAKAALIKPGKHDWLRPRHV